MNTDLALLLAALARAAVLADETKVIVYVWQSGEGYEVQPYTIGLPVSGACIRVHPGNTADIGCVDCERAELEAIEAAAPSPLLVRLIGDRAYDAPQPFNETPFPAPSTHPLREIARDLRPLAVQPLTEQEHAKIATLGTDDLRDLWTYPTIDAMGKPLAFTWRYCCFCDGCVLEPPQPGCRHPRLHLWEGGA